MAFQPGNKFGKGAPAHNKNFRATCRIIVDALVIKAWHAEVESHGPDWLRCSELLTAYGYGKPPQSVEVSGTLNLAAEEVKPLQTDELRQLIAATDAATHH